MSTKEENDALWDVSVTSKSWVEMVEDEDEVFAELSRSTSAKLSPPKVSTMKVVSHLQITKDNETEVRESKTLSVTSTLNDKMAPRNVPSIITEEESCDTYVGLPTISEESNDIKDSPPLKNVTQTYANILKNSPTAGISPLIKPEIKGEVKKELANDFLHEDISLTGHIEGFQLTSPCKATTGFKTPTKSTDTLGVRSSPRNLKRKILQDTGSGVKVPDEVLMPSPSKIPRSTERRVTDTLSPMSLGSRGPASGSGKKYSNSRKRPRDMQTPPNNRRYERPPPELETNEEVLARRQKQIDYGKNTIGYERYRQLVPKECRKSIHPRTPPMRLKYSRRAWEGLVRIWRQRLHFWDPPSEGGGDPACLDAEISDISDLSSTDSSLPSTPVQDMKRRQVYTSPASLRPKHLRVNAAKCLDVSAPSKDDDLVQDCLPLSPE